MDGVEDWRENLIHLFTEVLSPCSGGQKRKDQGS
jgi:hypothetical protein